MSVQGGSSLSISYSFSESINPADPPNLSLATLGMDGDPDLVRFQDGDLVLDIDLTSNSGMVTWDIPRVVISDVFLIAVIHQDNTILAIVGPTFDILPPSAFFVTEPQEHSLIFPADSCITVAWENFPHGGEDITVRLGELQGQQHAFYSNSFSFVISSAPATGSATQANPFPKLVYPTDKTYILGFFQRGSEVYTVENLFIPGVSTTLTSTNTGVAGITEFTIEISITHDAGNFGVLVVGQSNAFHSLPGLITSPQTNYPYSFTVLDNYPLGALTVQVVSWYHPYTEPDSIVEISVSTPCDPGSYYNSTFYNCMSCGEDEFSTTQNSLSCFPHRKCIAAMEYESVSPTATTDRNCALATVCHSSHELVALTPTSDRVCVGPSTMITSTSTTSTSTATTAPLVDNGTDSGPSSNGRNLGLTIAVGIAGFLVFVLIVLIVVFCKPIS